MIRPLEHCEVQLCVQAGIEVHLAPPTMLESQVTQKCMHDIFLEPRIASEEVSHLKSGNPVMRSVDFDTPSRLHVPNMKSHSLLIEVLGPGIHPKTRKGCQPQTRSDRIQEVDDQNLKVESEVVPPPHQGM